MMVVALYNIVDQFFIGRSVGELGNAATNVAFPLSTSCIAVALLFGQGGASAFNLTMGEGDREKAAYYIGNAAALLFGCGIVLCAAVQIFLTPLMKFFGSPDDVLEYAKTYTRIVAFGFPFLILTSGGGHLIRADGSPRYAMYCNLSGAVINAILAPVFIFRLHMGMAGAGTATLIAQIIGGLVALRYLFRYRTVKLRLKHCVPQWRYVRWICSLGTAAFVNQAAMMVVQIALNNALTYYGARSDYGESIPLACAGVVIKVNQLFLSVVIGISQAIQPIASFNYGAKRFGRVRRVFWLSARVGFGISLAAFLLFQLFPVQIITLFGTGSEQYIRFAVKFFRIFLFFTFLDFLQPLASNFFTAIGKPGKGGFLSLTRQILFLLPLILLLPLRFGIDGITYAGPAADLIAAAVSALMVFRELRGMEQLERRETESPPEEPPKPEP